MLFQFTGQREEMVRMEFNLAKFLVMTMRTSFSGQFLVDCIGNLTGTCKAQTLIRFEYFRMR